MDQFKANNGNRNVSSMIHGQTWNAADLAEENVIRKNGIKYGNSQTPRVDSITDSVKAEQELTKSEVKKEQARRFGNQTTPSEKEKGELGKKQDAKFQQTRRDYQVQSANSSPQGVKNETRATKEAASLEEETAELEDEIPRKMPRNSARRKPKVHDLHRALQARAARKTRELEILRKKLDKKSERADNLKGGDDKLVGFADEGACLEEGTRSDDEVQLASSQDERKKEEEIKYLEEKVARLENDIQRTSLDMNKKSGDIKDLEEKVSQLKNDIYRASQDEAKKASDIKDLSQRLAAQIQQASISKVKAATLEAEVLQASRDASQKDQEMRHLSQLLATQTDKASTLEERIARLDAIVEKNRTEREQEISDESQQASFLQELQEKIAELEKQLSESSSLVEKKDEKIEGLQEQITGQLQQAEFTSDQLRKLEVAISDERALGEHRVTSLTSDIKEKAGELVKLKDSNDQYSREAKEKDEKIRELEEELAKRGTQSGNDDRAASWMKRQLEEKSLELKEKDVAIEKLKCQQGQQAASHAAELESLEKSSRKALDLVVAEKDKEIEDKLNEQIQKLASENAETRRLETLLKESSLTINEKDLEIEKLSKDCSILVAKKDEQIEKLSKDCSILVAKKDEQIEKLSKDCSILVAKKDEQIEKLSKDCSILVAKKDEQIEKLSKDCSILVAKKDEQIENLEHELEKQAREVVANGEEIERLKNLSTRNAEATRLKDDEIQSLKTSLHNQSKAVVKFQGDLQVLRLELEQKRDENGQQAEQIEGLRRKAEADQGYWEQQKRDSEQQLKEIGKLQEEIKELRQEAEDKEDAMVVLREDAACQIIELRGQVKARGFQVEDLLRQIRVQKAEVIVQRGKAEKYWTEIEELRNSHQEQMRNASAVSATLRSELDKARKQQASDQSKHVGELEKIRLGHEKQLEQVSVPRDQVKQLRLEVEKMQETHEIQVREISDAKEQLDEKEAAQGKLLVECDKLKGDIIDLNAKLESLRRINAGFIAGKAEATLKADIALKEAHIAEMNRKLSQQDRYVRKAQDAALKMVQIRRSLKLELPADNLVREILEMQLEIRPKEWAKKYALPDFNETKGEFDSKLEDQLALVAGEGKGLKGMGQKYEPDIIVTALLLQHIQDNVLSKPFLAFQDEEGLEFAKELMRCYDGFFEIDEMNAHSWRQQTINLFLQRRRSRKSSHAAGNGLLDEFNFSFSENLTGSFIDGPANVLLKRIGIDTKKRDRELTSIIEKSVCVGLMLWRYRVKIQIRGYKELRSRSFSSDSREMKTHRSQLGSSKLQKVDSVVDIVVHPSVVASWQEDGESQEKVWAQAVVLWH